MNSLAISITHPRTQFISGTSSLQRDQFVGSSNVLLIPCSERRSLKDRRALIVQASRDGRQGTVSTFVGTFVGGFVLGGVVVGALGCIFAPQLSKALTGDNRKDLMRKLPKFIYDEEKALEKTRKILTEKIEQLNTAIDEISSQLRANDPPPNRSAAVTTDEFEAYI